MKQGNSLFFFVVVLVGLVDLGLAQRGSIPRRSFSGSSSRSKVIFINEDFSCPEQNGLFADREQCDLYYVCSHGEAEALLCDDGLLFDTTIRNRERCVMPHGVDCGERIYVQEPQEGIDARCPRANGVFDHDDPDVCNKFYQCADGVPHEIACASPLLFDSVVGTCVQQADLSLDAKICGNVTDVRVVDGFSCPGSPSVGPLGITQAHPVFAHPTDCRAFFTCYFGTDPHKLGCTEGLVFDELSEVCKPPEEVPECKCWYKCPESCPGNCNPNCDCL